MSDINPVPLLLILHNSFTGESKRWTHDMPSVNVAKNWLRKKQLFYGAGWRAEIRNPETLDLITSRRFKGGEWEVPQKEQVA